MTNNIPIAEKENLTVKEAAKLFRIGDKNIYRWIHTGRRFDWLLKKGSWSLIRRKKFADWLEQYGSIDEIA